VSRMQNSGVLLQGAMPLLCAEWAAECKERELEKVALKFVKEQEKAARREAKAQVGRAPSVLLLVVHSPCRFPYHCRALLHASSPQESSCSNSLVLVGRHPQKAFGAVWWPG
jgi:hypothetical protein